MPHLILHGVSGFEGRHGSLKDHNRTEPPGDSLSPHALGWEWTSEQTVLSDQHTVGPAHVRTQSRAHHTRHTVLDGAEGDQHTAQLIETGVLGKTTRVTGQKNSALKSTGPARAKRSASVTTICRGSMSLDLQQLNASFGSQSGVICLSVCHRSIKACRGLMSTVSSLCGKQQ